MTGQKHMKPTKVLLQVWLTDEQSAVVRYLLMFGKMKSYDDLSLDIQSNLAAIGLITPIVNDLKSLYGSSVIIYK